LPLSILVYCSIEWISERAKKRQNKSKEFFFEKGRIFDVIFHWKLGKIANKITLFSCFQIVFDFSLSREPTIYTFLRVNFVLNFFIHNWKALSLMCGCLLRDFDLRFLCFAINFLFTNDPKTELSTIKFFCWEFQAYVMWRDISFVWQVSEHLFAWLS
jgi:hypothetical protein